MPNSAARRAGGRRRALSSTRRAAPPGAPADGPLPPPPPPPLPALGPGSRPRARRSPGMAVSCWMLTGEESRSLSVSLWKPKSRKQLRSQREGVKPWGAGTQGTASPLPDPSTCPCPCPGGALPGAALQLEPVRDFFGLLLSGNSNQ